MFQVGAASLSGFGVQRQVEAVTAVTRLFFDFRLYGKLHTRLEQLFVVPRSQVESD